MHIYAPTRISCNENVCVYTYLGLYIHILRNFATFTCLFTHTQYFHVYTCVHKIRIDTEISKHIHKYTMSIPNYRVYSLSNQDTSRINRGVLISEVS